MDTEILRKNHHRSTFERLLPAVVPVLLISVAYVDPGKWAAVVDGGAHFGSDLVPSMFVFNLAAVFCHYLSAQIALVTGRNLSQICSEEYNKATCVFLGVLLEFTMVALDLTLILGTAHLFNLLIGVDLFTCVFLAAIDAVLHHVFVSFLNNGKGRFLCILLAGFTLLFYVGWVLRSQPEVSISTSGMLTKLSGESAFALMSLLGASMMPHNVYLQSSIVQHECGPPKFRRGLLNHDHFFAILCIFSSVFLVNLVFMNAAASSFYNNGVGLLTFQDALSLIDQLFNSSTIPFALLPVLFGASQVSAFTWNLGRQAILFDFLGLDIPGWLHHATIRIIAIMPALYCVWNLGAEGMYQLLVSTQVLVALVLPPSVIPLFRVASSQPIMGAHKISQFLEFQCLALLVGMLGLKIIFLVEMIFGDSDWVNNMLWNMGSGITVSYAVLIITAFTSLCLMLWLAATPLASSTLRSDAQRLNWKLNDAVPDLSAERDQGGFMESEPDRIKLMQKQEPSLELRKSLEFCPNKTITNRDLNWQETIYDSTSVAHSTPVQEDGSDITGTSLSVFHANETDSIVGTVENSAVCQEDTVGESVDSSALKPKSTSSEEKTEKVEVGLHGVKEVADSVSNSSALPEGPGSYRSLSGATDESGSGTGSFSRLAGLGRAGRRQLAAYLDEFWGQLFDFHGQATQDAKAKKLDVLLGFESKADPRPSSSVKTGTKMTEFVGCNSSLSNSVMSPSVYNSSDTYYGVEREPAPLSVPRSTLLDAYVRNYGGYAFDSSERRYSSLRIPSSSGGSDTQPATVHGYQLSYLSHLAKQKPSDILNGNVEALTPKSPLWATPNYKDPPGFASGRKYNGVSAMAPPGFSKPIVSRNTSLQSKTSSFDGYSHGSVDNLNHFCSEKKFFSSPDISRLSQAYRNSYLSGRSAQGEIPMGYDSSLYSSTKTKAEVPLALDNLSYSEPQGDRTTLTFGLSSETGSLFSREPVEQISVADKPDALETSSVIALQAKLLRSFRNCILKLSKLEGSEWLFRQNDGADEDLIHHVAAWERFTHELEAREINDGVDMAGFQYSFDQKSVSHCGEGCIWGMDLIISFGVWCIRRVLELSLMESRPELWGKYTYVLNRLQGIIDLAFSKPRTPMTPCFCLQIPVEHQQKSSSTPVTYGSLPPPPHVKQNKGKCTSAAMVLETIKDVEIAISCRKGRSGTAAGDVAFPKGKENLVSVLKRYKRRLSSKQVG